MTRLRILTGLLAMTLFAAAGAVHAQGRRSISREIAATNSEAGTRRRTAIAKSQYEHRRAQNGTCT